MKVNAENLGVQIDRILKNWDRGPLSLEGGL